MAEQPDATDEDRELDLEVGLRVAGYRWMEWNHRSMADAPHFEPGRFVAHPDDLQSHLQVEADPDAPLAAHAFQRLPPYSTDVRLAVEAAERGGLFLEGGAVLSKSDDGEWRITLQEVGTSLEDDSLSRLLCRAALRWAEAGRVAEGL